MNNLSDLRIRITQLVDSMAPSIDMMVLLTQVRTMLGDVSPVDFPFCPQQPYSRSILCAHERVEIMIARWTPNIHCAPHDHGEANSLIYVLSGRAEHKLYQIKSHMLHHVYTEQKKEGEIIRCIPKQIHSMGTKTILLTLHVYTPLIQDMIVYDLVAPETFLVRGTCGAWLPVENIKDILARRKGHYVRGQV